MTRKVLNRRRFVGLLAGTLLFAACANDRDDTQPVADTSATESTAAAAESTTTAPETAATTERIVSLSATATEMRSEPVASTVSESPGPRIVVASRSSMIAGPATVAPASLFSAAPEPAAE